MTEVETTALRAMGDALRAGARLTKLVQGEDIPDGDVLFFTPDGAFSEHTLHQRIRWLLQCEAAIKSMADQICSPKTTPEQFVAEVLDLPNPKPRASR